MSSLRRFVKNADVPWIIGLAVNSCVWTQSFVPPPAGSLIIKGESRSFPHLSGANRRFQARWLKTGLRSKSRPSSDLCSINFGDKTFAAPSWDKSHRRKRKPTFPGWLRGWLLYRSHPGWLWGWLHKAMFPRTCLTMQSSEKLMFDDAKLSNTGAHFLGSLTQPLFFYTLQKE